MSAAIEDYGIIGDCETVALVGRNGSIDWCCLPRFDSDACFASLLGKPENGRWLLAPTSAIKKTSRRYRDRTLILETRFDTADGSVTVIDFMRPRRWPLAEFVERGRGPDSNSRLSSTHNSRLLPVLCDFCSTSRTAENGLPWRY